MAVDLEKRARRFLLRLGSVPGDPTEARAFVQRRVRIYLGVVLGIWTGVFVLDRIITLAFTGRLFWGQNVSAWLHCAIVVGLAALYGVASRGERSMVTMGVVELFGTAGQGALLSAL